MTAYCIKEILVFYLISSIKVCFPFSLFKHMPEEGVFRPSSDSGGRLEDIPMLRLFFLPVRTLRTSSRGGLSKVNK